MNKEKEDLPTGLVFTHTIKKLLGSFEWLHSLEEERKILLVEKRDYFNHVMRQGILIDTISMYVASLLDKRGNCHSFIKTYSDIPIAQEFKGMDFVKKLCLHRHNRVGHNNKKSGFIFNSVAFFEHAELNKFINYLNLFLLDLNKLQR